MPSQMAAAPRQSLTYVSDSAQIVLGYVVVALNFWVLILLARAETIFDGLPKPQTGMAALMIDCDYFKSIHDLQARRRRLAG